MSAARLAGKEELQAFLAANPDIEAVQIMITDPSGVLRGKSVRREELERIFDSKVFVVSFVFNVLVAALIVYLGDQLGVGTQLSTAIIVVLGIRIFGNAAALRRRLFGA